MRKDLGAKLVVTACCGVGLAACGVGVLPPITPQEVTVRLHLTGGIAGIDQTITLDGADRLVSVSCVGVCMGEEGDFPVSDTQVGIVARHLDDAGAFDLDGSDFGTACCDMIDATLTYERAGATATMSGTTARFPATLHPALEALQAMASRRLPFIVSAETTPTDWPSDALAVDSVRAVGGALEIGVTYSGGCAAHRMDAVAWGGWMESFPVQINVYVTHDGADDPCDALPSVVRRFDMAPLRAAYEEAYGPIGEERPTVILRVEGPSSEAAILLEVEL